MNDRCDIVEGDVSIRDGRIAAIGSSLTGLHDRVIDARGGFVLPGLIQTHIHLCQTLFRGYADDLPLMDWLRHARLADGSRAHAGVAARRGAAGRRPSCSRSGTTAVLTMETVHDTDVVFEAVAESGLRATIGKCMMDCRRRGAAAAAGADASVDRREPRAPRAMARRRERPAARGVRAALRGVLFARAARSGRRPVSRSISALVHTHASESREEIAIVRAALGRAEQPRVPRRACSWRRRGSAPRTASGSTTRAGAARRARRQGDALPRFESEAGIGRRAGAGDARARHHRLARRRRRRLQQPARHVRGNAARRRASGDAAAARACCRRATSCGWRRATGRGRSASSTRSDRSRSASAPTSSSSIAIGRTSRPGPDPYSTLVYAARGTDVRTTIVDGEVLVDEFAPVRVDRRQIAARPARRPGSSAARARPVADPLPPSHGFRDATI